MEDEIDKQRRTTLKIVGTTGLAAAGVISTSGTAVAQQEPSFTIDDGSDSTQVVSGEVTEYGAVEETQRPLPNLQEIIVEITDIDEEAETVSGTVTAVSRGQGRGAQQDTAEFTDAPVQLADTNDVGTAQTDSVTILELVIEDLFLNLLGLQVFLDLNLLVEAVEGQGLLGDLLVALLGSN